MNEISTDFLKETLLKLWATEGKLKTRLILARGVDYSVRGALDHDKEQQQRNHLIERDRSQSYWLHEINKSTKVCEELQSQIEALENPQMILQNAMTLLQFHMLNEARIAEE